MTTRKQINMCSQKCPCSAPDDGAAGHLTRTAFSMFLWLYVLSRSCWGSYLVKWIVRSTLQIPSDWRSLCALVYPLMGKPRLNESEDPGVRHGSAQLQYGLREGGPGRRAKAHLQTKILPSTSASSNRKALNISFEHHPPNH